MQMQRERERGGGGGERERERNRRKREREKEKHEHKERQKEEREKETSTIYDNKYTRYSTTILYYGFDLGVGAEEGIGIGIERQKQGYEIGEGDSERDLTVQVKSNDSTSSTQHTSISHHITSYTDEQQTWFTSSVWHAHEHLCMCQDNKEKRRNLIRF